MSSTTQSGAFKPPAVKTQPTSKRRRTQISEQQVRELEMLFDVDPWPSAEDKIALSRRLELSFQSVQVWFQNRRARAKRQDEVSHARVYSVDSDDDDNNDNDNQSDKAVEGHR
ncbi:hypothetical protein CAOG_05256 [Capsaspora owczarzaki ATCC 30864]|uniref:hypothetical protein n=1 Tax=Capsaspora owczarzaki (strain ATCC 30864) TaxID=595528 RepID=UPI0001FE4AC3|nr:hypothetical protein CAOG_05256 [Capsaspora owczarzaki ATCC 30864]|eukprot:XP_004346941.1 hypothetical protein CAOG_05256 [Capsaspora owczarzaki ATCC 30864]